MEKSKSSLMIAVILVGLSLIIYLGVLFWTISAHQATLFVVIVFSGAIALSVYALFDAIRCYRKPLSPEEIAAKKEKERRVALILTPFVLILLMVWRHNYSNPLVWALVVFSMLGCIQYLPSRARAFIGRGFGVTFGGLWKVLKPIGWILIAILILTGVIALLHGLATISTTNALLLLILWVMLSRGEKGN